MTFKRILSTLVLTCFTAAILMFVYQMTISSLSMDYAKLKSEKLARDAAERASLALKIKKEQEEEGKNYKEDTRRELDRRDQLGSPAHTRPNKSDIENQIRYYDPEKKKFMRDALCAFYQTC